MTTMWQAVQDSSGWWYVASERADGSMTQRDLSLAPLTQEKAVRAAQARNRPTCQHPDAMRIDSEERPYFAAIAQPATTDPRAHGSIAVTVVCSACGSIRDENRNRTYVEASHWRAR